MIINGFMRQICVFTIIKLSLGAFSPGTFSHKLSHFIPFFKPTLFLLF